jgi:hypothetical protein
MTPEFIMFCALPAIPPGGRYVDHHRNVKDLLAYPAAQQMRVAITIQLRRLIS